jgi:hypothetical protein
MMMMMIIIIMTVGKNYLRIKFAFACNSDSSLTLPKTAGTNPWRLETKLNKYKPINTRQKAIHTHSKVAWVEQDLPWTWR